ncbi:hypothetical protein PCANC_28065 [Puccinia coronata f. sp. avenae]|uniref:Uncharacterized protein n=1 Tax=Puccinia coronata f. sp. avenae TaxID=200324 RepID=A0A2N5TJN0_9BASI|nr:hypothetical protein PCANC_28065 [Puccinia coronata f. sp. avenae]
MTAKPALALGRGGLRNGKDLLFEQRRAAKRAAARDAGTNWQQQQLADLTSRSSSPELPLPSAFHSYHELPNANGPASSIRQSSANNGLSAPGSAIDHPSVLGNQPAAGYTLSPAALKKIRLSGEQQQVAGATSSINLSGAIKLRPTSDLCASTGLSDPASHRSAAGGYPPIGNSLSSDALEQLCRAQEPQSDAQKLGQDGPLNLQPSGSPRPREIHVQSHTSSGRVHDFLKHLSGSVVPVYQRSAERQHASHENSPSPSGFYPANPSKHTRRRQTQVRPAQAQLHQQAPVQQQQPSQEPMTPPPSPTATPPATGPLQGSQIQHPTAQEQHHVQLQPPLQSNHHHYAQHPRQNGSQFNPPYPRNRRLRYRGGRSNPNSSIAPLDQLPPNPQ